MSDDRFSLLRRLRSMGDTGWNPIGNEAADEIERLSTEGAELRLHLSRVVDAYFNDTGAEPSVSVLGRAADEARAYLTKERVNDTERKR